MRPVLRYHGGKHKFARRLIPLFPPHRVYVDVVVNVFQVLRCPDKCEQLKKNLELTPFSRTEFNSTFGHRPKHQADVEAARLCVLRSFAGFGSAATNGDYATGFRSNSNRSGTTSAHDWVNYPECLRHFCDRLRGVIIENKDALEIIPQHDSEQTLFYCDPPYLHATRNMARGNAAYSCEMTDQDHRLLAEALRAVRGMVVLSGYDCDLYRRLYGCWKHLSFTSLADGARKRTETVWFNENAYSGMSQKPMEFIVEFIEAAS